MNRPRVALCMLLAIYAMSLLAVGQADDSGKGRSRSAKNATPAPVGGPATTARDVIPDGFTYYGPDDAAGFENSADTVSGDAFLGLDSFSDPYAYEAGEFAAPVTEEVVVQTPVSNDPAPAPPAAELILLERLAIDLVETVQQASEQWQMPDWIAAATVSLPQHDEPMLTVDSVYFDTLGQDLAAEEAYFAAEQAAAEAAAVEAAIVEAFQPTMPVAAAIVEPVEPKIAANQALSVSIPHEACLSLPSSYSGIRCPLWDQCRQRMNDAWHNMTSQERSLIENAEIGGDLLGAFESAAEADAALMEEGFLSDDAGLTSTGTSNSSYGLDFGVESDPYYDSPLPMIEAATLPTYGDDYGYGCEEDCYGHCTRGSHYAPQMPSPQPVSVPASKSPAIIEQRSDRSSLSGNHWDYSNLDCGNWDCASWGGAIWDCRTAERYLPIPASRQAAVASQPAKIEAKPAQSPGMNSGLVIVPRSMVPSAKLDSLFLNAAQDLSKFWKQAFAEAQLAAENEALEMGWYASQTPPVAKIAPTIDYQPVVDTLADWFLTGQQRATQFLAQFRDLHQRWYAEHRYPYDDAIFSTYGSGTDLNWELDF